METHHERVVTYELGLSSQDMIRLLRALDYAMSYTDKELPVSADRELRNWVSDAAVTLAEEMRSAGDSQSIPRRWQD